MLNEEEIVELLKYAKLQPENFQKNAQVLKYSSNFIKDDCCIFKLNKDILAELETKDFKTTFQIKGNEQNQAVLCTHNKNYEVRECETSNTILLSSDLNFQFQDENVTDFTCTTATVSASCSKIYELKPKKAKPGEVYKILKKTMLYDHLDLAENEIFYDFNRLSDKVVMSESELLNIMKILKVYTYENSLRILDINYSCDILQKIIDCSIESDFELECLSQKNVYVLLSDLYPKEILEQTLDYFFNVVTEQGEDILLKIDDKEVGRCYADRCLQSLHNACSREPATVNMDEFMLSWRGSLPSDWEYELDPVLSLAGLAVFTDSGSLVSLRSWDLPDEPTQRLNVLFSVKSHWLAVQLEPFLSEVVPPQTTVSEILTRLARCSTRDGVKLFSRR